MVAHFSIPATARLGKRYATYLCKKKVDASAPSTALVDLNLYKIIIRNSQIRNSQTSKPLDKFYDLQKKSYCYELDNSIVPY